MTNVREPIEGNEERPDYVGYHKSPRKKCIFILVYRDRFCYTYLLYCCNTSCAVFPWTTQHQLLHKLWQQTPPTKQYEREELKLWWWNSEQLVDLLKTKYKKTVKLSTLVDQDFHNKCLRALPRSWHSGWQTGLLENSIKLSERTKCQCDELTWNTRNQPKRSQNSKCSKRLHIKSSRAQKSFY